jgi:hypothetical protein
MVARLGVIQINHADFVQYPAVSCKILHLSTSRHGPFGRVPQEDKEQRNMQFGIMGTAMSKFDIGGMRLVGTAA